MAREAQALHVERSGSGPPLVLWHGWALNLRVFDALRGALGSAWRTHAVDLPGHGLSPWLGDDEDAVLDALLATLPPASTLLGWSLGGQFALRAALAAPDRVARLVLVGATPRFLEAPGWPHGVPAAVLAQIESRLAADWRGTVGDFLELQVRGSPDAGRAATALRAAVAGHGEATREALSGGLGWLARHDLRGSLAQLRQPVLVVAGGHDRVTPPSACAALAAALPDARHVQLARASHAPFLSHPDAFLAALRPFLGLAGTP